MTAIDSNIGLRHLSALTRIATLFIAIVLAGSAWADEPLSRRERKELTAKLPEVHRQFLIDVDPIIVLTERDTFLRLATSAQRDAFIDDFWRRRDIARGTTNNAARHEYYAHLEYVKEAFGQTSSDRSRIYLVHGPPADIIDIKCQRHLQPTQVWRFAHLPGFGHDYRLLFYVPRQQRDYRLWEPMDAERAYRELIATGIEAAGPPRNIIYDCPNGEEVVRAMSQMSADKLRLQRIYDPPVINEEDVNRILRSVVLPTANAPKLEAELSVAYPAGDGRRTDAQITIMVPRAQLKTTEAGGVALYVIDVIGEVLRDEKMWEKYRYRFDFPAGIEDEKLPIVIDRFLRPAEYVSRIKLTDTATGAEAILETPLSVPEVKVASKPTEETAALQVIQEDLLSSRARLRIVPLTDGVAAGLQTIQTISSGSIEAVEFWLDGKKVATRRTPPYILDLDFGTVPRPRRVRVVAIDSHGEPITGDEVVVNSGTDPFRVRIVSPRIAPKLSGATRVELEVRVPEGKSLESVELFWNETRVSTMYDPPFVQTVNIPKAGDVGYLRAVARLDDPEIDAVEDVVMVNTPDYMETIDVHLVELPTTVIRNGKPVTGLTEESFKVFDEGQPVKLAKFEFVEDLSLSIGMAIDTSGSMESRMSTARAAGAAFFQNVLRPRDKAFLVAFDSQPHLVQKWSNKVSDIYSGLARLRPEESTALYDAVVYSLYNFLGVKGQKALVIVSDGRDTVSKFTFQQAVEYAQRAAVPIYTIGIAIGRTDIEARSRLNRFANETGGTSYYIDDVKDLSKIYDDIQNELRSQYVLGFYPPPEVKAGGKWRELNVQVGDGQVKTIRGYYP
ncbi:MAG TPA: VWA domain-containing protein [Thermoanaerobaculia bacterium]